MSTSTITIRVDKELKKRAEEIFENIGISTTTAFTLFMKKVIRDEEIPFKLQIDPFYSKENIEEIKSRIKDLDEGMNVVYKTIEELNEMKDEK
jgi:DNA-damage-inducible protein J